MEVQIDLEKITGCVKHVPFRRKRLMWSVKIGDFHKKIKKSPDFGTAQTRTNIYRKIRRFFSHQSHNFDLIFVFIGLRGNYESNKQESHL